MLGSYLAPDWQRRVRDAGAQLATANGASWVGLRFGSTVSAATLSANAAQLSEERIAMARQHQVAALARTR